MKKQNENPLAPVVSETLPDRFDVIGKDERFEYRWVRKDRLGARGEDPFRKWKVCSVDEVKTNLVENFSDGTVYQDIDVILCKRPKEIGENIRHVQDTKKRQQKEVLASSRFSKGTGKDTNVPFYVKEATVE